MPRTIAPYGSWVSPLTPEMLVEAAVTLADVAVEGDWVYWSERRPSEGARQVIVRCRTDGTDRTDVLPQGFSARTLVHEYGGRCFAVHGEVVVFSNWDDQRLWILEPGATPRPLTPAPDEPRADRFADPVFLPGGRSVVCVREHHQRGAEAVNDLVVVNLDPATANAPPRRVVGGHDFFSYPRVSPDGSRLAWVSWDHPHMPWDATDLWVADLLQGAEPDLSTPVHTAGGPDESVTQPVWSPSGSLHYVSDRTGWWNIYDESGRALSPIDADFAEPDWVFGYSSYTFLPDGTLVATWTEAARTHLGLVSGGSVDEVRVPFHEIDSLHAVPGGVAAIAGSPTDASAVVVIESASGKTTVLARSRADVPERGYLSVPEPIEFPTGDGAHAYALFYPPANADFTAPDKELPPLVVIVHGGPTGSTYPVLSLERVQYWTSRGFAVADVDYRGSTGHGRAYRQLLDGAWGIADVEDCAAVVRWLAEQGRIDGKRAVIRGGSAGGFTTLACLAFTDVFAAGASHYGVADLELLARDTHKFESRYLDGLVGPWPAAAEEYQRRSPIYHVEQINSPLILFQGLEDKVVPPEQSEMMFRALSDRGVEVEYRAFEGEQHGFRQAATIIEVAKAELAFYGRVLGFSPPA